MRSLDSAINAVVYAPIKMAVIGTLLLSATIHMVRLAMPGKRCK